AEAAHDLVVAIEARDHEHLLVELRALGEGVEVARVEARGDEEVPRAAGRVLHHEGRLDLDEAVAGGVLARGAGERAADEEVALELGAAEVEIAELEALVFVRLDVVLVGDGRGLGLVEDAGLARLALDVAGRHLGVAHGAAIEDAPADADHPLGADTLGEREGLGAGVGLEDDLGDATAVTEVDEDAAAVIATDLDPAEEDDLLAKMLES